jgi:hypothetical protein
VDEGLRSDLKSSSGYSAASPRSSPSFSSGKAPVP